MYYIKRLKKVLNKKLLFTSGGNLYKYTSGKVKSSDHQICLKLEHMIFFFSDYNLVKKIQIFYSILRKSFSVRFGSFS